METAADMHLLPSRSAGPSVEMFVRAPPYYHTECLIHPLPYGVLMAFYSYPKLVFPSCPSRIQPPQAR